MKKNRPIQSDSLQFRLWIMLSAVFLVALIMIGSTMYAIRLISVQVATAHRDTVTMHLDRIEGLFSSVECRLYGILSYETELRLIEENRNNNRTKLAQKRMADLISEESHSYPYMDGFFIYMPDNGTYLESRSVFTVASFTEKEKFRQNLSTYLADKKSNMDFNEWVSIQLEEEYYFLRTIRFGNILLGAWVNAEGLLDTLRISDSQSQDYIFFVTTEGFPMTSRDELLTGNYNFNGNLDTYYFTNWYMVAGAEYPNGACRMLTMIELQKLFAGLGALCFFSVVFSVLSVFLIPFILIKIHRWIVEPVDELVTAMDKLKQGDLTVELKACPVCGEFKILNNSFTDMSRQIKKLKLDVYEEKLMKQKTQLHYFQLQVHPHFFVNSLNMIYNLAQVREYDLVQKLAMSLCQYYRFSTKNTGDFITLQEELDHLQRYMDIQKIRFGAQLQVYIHIDPMLANVKIPPLTIETFVENAVKYAMDMDHLTEIMVTIQNDPEIIDKVYIRIMDNGPGFSEEMMEDILTGKQLKVQEGGRQIGIYNVYQRLWLLYGEEAELSITNREPHGMLVEIRLPKKERAVPDD